MFYLICYDIKSNYRRNKVAQLLEGFGMRVQLSVFECVLTNSQQAIVHKALKRLIDKTTDQVRFYPLSSRERQNVYIMGLQPEMRVDDAAYIV